MGSSVRRTTPDGDVEGLRNCRGVSSLTGAPLSWTFVTRVLRVRIDEHGRDEQRERGARNAPGGPRRNVQNTSDRNVMPVDGPTASPTSFGWNTD